MGQDELSGLRLNSRLLNHKQEVAASSKGNQAGPRDVGGCILSIVEELKAVVRRMDDKRRSNSFFRISPIGADSGKN